MADPISMPIYGLLKAIAEGLDTQPIRRRHGDYLIETLELSTGHTPDDRDVKLHQHTVSVNLPKKVRDRFARLYRQKNPGKRPPDLDPVGVHLEKVVKMRVRWPSLLSRGRITIAAPGAGDRWSWGGWVERSHRIPIGRRRDAQRDMGRLIAAIWYLRPDLLDAAKVTEAIDRARDNRRRKPTVGGRQVVMSDNVGGRRRRHTPTPASQQYTEPRHQETARGWGGREVRYRR